MAIEFDMLANPSMQAMDIADASMASIIDPTMAATTTANTTFDVINDLLVNVIFTNIKPDATVAADDEKDIDNNQQDKQDDTASADDDTSQAILSMLFSTAMLAPPVNIDQPKLIQAAINTADKTNDKTNDDMVGMKKNVIEKELKPTEFAQSTPTSEEQDKKPIISVASDIPDITTMFKLDSLHIPTYHHAMPASVSNQFDLVQSQNSDSMAAIASKIGMMINQQTMPNYQFSVNDIQIIDTQTEINNAAVVTKSPAEFNVEIPLRKEHMSNQIVDAYIKIYPPELGHVLAKIKINSLRNTADLQIQTQNLQVKQIIEANLPALRNSFSQTPIQLASVQIDVKPSFANGNLQQDLKQNKQSYEEIQSEEKLKLSFVKQNVENPHHKSDSLVDTYA